MSAYPPSESERRVVPFRPRESPFMRPLPAVAPARDSVHDPVKDLAQYERTPGDGPEEFHHRMKMNGLAAVVLVVLMAIGWWLADSMANLRKDQDCALSGRKNCETITVPLAQRYFGDT